MNHHRSQRNSNLARAPQTGVVIVAQVARGRLARWMVQLSYLVLRDGGSGLAGHGCAVVVASSRGGGWPSGFWKVEAEGEVARLGLGRAGRSPFPSRHTQWSAGARKPWVGGVVRKRATWEVGMLRRGVGDLRRASQLDVVRDLGPRRQQTLGSYRSRRRAPSWRRGREGASSPVRSSLGTVVTHSSRSPSGRSE